MSRILQRHDITSATATSAATHHDRQSRRPSKDLSVNTASPPLVLAVDVEPLPSATGDGLAPAPSSSPPLTGEGVSSCNLRSRCDSRAKGVADFQAKASAGRSALNSSALAPCDAGGWLIHRGTVWRRERFKAVSTKHSPGRKHEAPAGYYCIRLWIGNESNTCHGMLS